MPFDQSQGATWGCFRREIEGARGTAIGTGQRNTADMLAGSTEAASAAQLCAALSFNGVRGWFLPPRAELAEMHQTLRATGLDDFRDAGTAANCEYLSPSTLVAVMASHLQFH